MPRVDSCPRDVPSIRGQCSAHPPALTATRRAVRECPAPAVRTRSAAHRDARAAPACRRGARCSRRSARARRVSSTSGRPSASSSARSACASAWSGSCVENRIVMPRARSRSSSLSTRTRLPKSRLAVGSSSTQNGRLLRERTRDHHQLAFAARDLGDGPLGERADAKRRERFARRRVIVAVPAARTCRCATRGPSAPHRSR